MYDEQKYLKADGFDDAIVGTAHGIGVNEDAGPILVYDIDKCIDILMDTNPDWERVDAEEYFSFNVIGAFVGPQTPIFLDRGYVEYSKAQKKLDEKDIYLDHLRE